MSHGKSVTETLEKLIRRFVDSCGGAIDEVIIARPDGLIVHSYSSSMPMIQKRNIAALITLVIGSSKRVYNQLRDDELETILMEGRKSKIILKSISLNGGKSIYVGVLLSCSETSEANIGLILLMLEELTEKLKELFKVTR